jgi:predicted DNA-binding mobile mystery protein A
MATVDQARRARQRLDARLRALQPGTRYTPPAAGWVRAIREALGMSQSDLAARLGVTLQSVQGLEASERAGRVRLDSLRRAADAMGCTVEYVLLPRTSLDETVVAQAVAIMNVEAAAGERSMALEAQDATLLPSAARAMVERLVDSKRLWRR